MGLLDSEHVQQALVSIESVKMETGFAHSIQIMTMNISGHVE